MGRLIFVSNRLPYTVRRQAGGTYLARSSGGLVAGLGPVHDRQDSLWIGNLGGEIEGLRREDLEKLRLVPVALPRERARRHYEGFSNGVLWPLFHYFLESLEYDPEDFEAYRFVNERFADAVAQQARPGDRVWIHDYHLMLLPSMLRERLPDMPIGFFLHIPFPSSEVFRVLPVGEVLLRGLLGADLVGLHTNDYVRHLVTSFRRFLGSQFDHESIDCEGRRCHIRVFPLGVDAARHAELAASPAVDRRLRNWQRRVTGRKVVLGVDRLDYSKGITLRLESYRRLLSTHPIWRKGVLFLQIAVPTRSAIPQYRNLKQQVEQRVGEINGEFGDLGSVPVHYMYRSVPPEELAALYRLADVAMVTPVRDGMNLVAKEYIASRTDDTGVLVLSEFAGAASELGEALVVNVWDLDRTVEALDRALRMDPEEQRVRMSALRKRVAGYDAHRWARSFIESLDECAGERRREVTQPSGEAWVDDLLKAFAAARRPLLVLDYDGTLREFDVEPEVAHPDAGLLDLVAGLSRVPHVTVVLLSGRSRETLQDWFGHLPVHLIAENGFYLRPSGQQAWEELSPWVDLSWKSVVEEAMASYVARTPGSTIERKHAGLAFHYRKVDPNLGLRQGRELAHHLTEHFANRPLRVLHDACVVDVLSQGIDKGSAYRSLVRELGEFDFILAAGDDRSDEDLFQALSADVWSIKVGPGPTGARFRAASAGRLRALLASVLEGCRPLPHSMRTAAVAPSRRGVALPEGDLSES